MVTGRFKDRNDISWDDWRKRDWFFIGYSFKKGLQKVDVLTKIGKKCSKTAGQVAINWLLCKDTTFPLFGASNIEQVKENCGAAGWRLDHNS